MAKTRLTEAKRVSILDYMKKHHEGRLDLTDENTMRGGEIVSLVNAAIRMKYPEEDMVVLRKYRCSSIDRWLRFQQTSNGRVFGIDFCENSEGLADLARNHGCNYGDVFPVGDDLADVHERYEAVVHSCKVSFQKKSNEYEAFVWACKTVEDIETVVPLPPGLRLRLTGANTALVAVSAGDITNLKAEFAEAA